MSLLCPLSSHHRLTWQLAAWLFHNGDGEGRGEGKRKGIGWMDGREEERGSCVVIKRDIIIELRGRSGTNALWELGNIVVRKPNQVCNRVMEASL